MIHKSSLELARKQSNSIMDIQNADNKKSFENNAIMETKKNNPMGNFKFGQRKSTGRTGSFNDDQAPKNHDIADEQMEKIPEKANLRPSSQKLDDLHSKLKKDFKERDKSLTKSITRKSVKFDKILKKSSTAPLRDLSGLKEA